MPRKNLKSQSLQRIAGVVFAIDAALLLFGFIDSARPGSRASAQPVPAFVLPLAKRFESAHARPAYLPPGSTLEAYYADQFFQGFRCGSGCGILNAPPLETEAYLSGVAYRNAHFDGVDDVMAAYGYRRVAVDGVWQSSFEVSRLVPESHPDEAWWLDGGVGEPSATAARVHVDGYLSPKGQHGHLGQYDRELQVLSLEPAAAGLSIALASIPLVFAALLVFTEMADRPKRRPAS